MQLPGAQHDLVPTLMQQHPLAIQLVLHKKVQATHDFSTRAATASGVQRWIEVVPFTQHGSKRHERLHVTRKDKHKHARWDVNKTMAAGKC